MATLGEELKRKREERNITLSEISEATRIGIRFLKAIDTDNYSVLPGGIFTRSFIRAYAKEVGMSEDEAISLYNQQTASQVPAEPPPANSKQSVTSPIPPSPSSPKKPPSIVYASDMERPSRSMSMPRTPTRTNWGTIIIAAGILVIIGVVVTALVRQLNKAQATKATQTITTPGTTTPESANPSAQQPPQQPESPAAPSGGAGQQTPAATSIPAGDTIVVKLEAAGDAWVRYQVDDGQPSQMILKQGQVQEIPPAQSAVKLNYGNRQSLKLVINNREANFPADAPKFKSQVIISRDTLQSFFQPPPSQ